MLIKKIEGFLTMMLLVTKETWKMEKVKTTVISATKEVAAAARATNPTQNPKKFFNEAAKRFHDWPKT